ALDFEVIMGIDQTGREMKRLVRKFKNRLKASQGVGFFYYAGHGMQQGSTNYLIPIGADIQAEEDVPDEAVSASWVLNSMDSAGNKLNVVVLDACRNNPLGRGFSRSGSTGLAQTDFQGKIGTLIAYATGPGRTAKDGRGRNSPFAKHLKTAIQVPGLELMDIFRQVTRNVQKETSNFQRPWQSSSLGSSFYFIPPVGGAPTSVSYTTPQVVPQKVSTTSFARAVVAALALGIMAFYFWFRPAPTVVEVNPFARLNRDSLGTMYAASAVAYICDGKTGKPLAPVLPSKATLIGRDPKSGLVMHDDAVSGRHAQISYKDGKFILVDLDSSNGTFVDGKQIPASKETEISRNTSFFLALPNLLFTIRHVES
ncbi:MAG: caspase family protein, partial [Pseudomonadota bacterium]